MVEQIRTTPQIVQISHQWLCELSGATGCVSAIRRPAKRLSDDDVTPEGDGRPARASIIFRAAVRFRAAVQAMVQAMVQAVVQATVQAAVQAMVQAAVQATVETAVLATVQAEVKGVVEGAAEGVVKEVALRRVAGIN